MFGLLENFFSVARVTNNYAFWFLYETFLEYIFYYDAIWHINGWSLLIRNECLAKWWLIRTPVIAIYWRRLRFGGVYHCFTELLMDLSLLVGVTEFQYCCHNNVVLFLINMNISLEDIFWMILFGIFSIARKAALSAISFPFILTWENIPINSMSLVHFRLFGWFRFWATGLLLLLRRRENHW